MPAQAVHSRLVISNTVSAASPQAGAASHHATREEYEAEFYLLLREVECDLPAHVQAPPSADTGVYGSNNGTGEVQSSTQTRGVPGGEAITGKRAGLLMAELSRGRTTLLDAQQGRERMHPEHVAVVG